MIGMMMMTRRMMMMAVTRNHKDDVGNGIAPVVLPCYTNQSHALNSFLGGLLTLLPSWIEASKTA